VPANNPTTVRGGQIQIGVSARAPGFAFDNERPGLVVDLPGFEIDSAPVTTVAFARFVDAGGYDQPRYWPGEAGVWRAQSGRNHPQQWRRAPAGSSTPGWQMRWFDQWLPLQPGMPAIHLNAFEAEAYCLWVGRRLPSAAQWECAARQMPALHWGHSVWEWTADAFNPYPGFAPGPYREYSAPWFGDHRELRGGAFATHARLHDARYRNFFLPHRTDVFTGFRTASPC
jgi:gamma-glutamyl hercynylcysteine S-oxide synthase